MAAGRVKAQRQRPGEHQHGDESGKRERADEGAGLDLVAKPLDGDRAWPVGEPAEAKAANDANDEEEDADHLVRALLQGRRRTRAPRFRACSTWHWRKGNARIVEPAGIGVAGGRWQRFDLLDGGGKVALIERGLGPRQNGARLTPTVASPTRRMDTADLALAIMLSRKDVSAGACCGAVQRSSRRSWQGCAQARPRSGCRSRHGKEARRDLPDRASETASRQARRRRDAQRRRHRADWQMRWPTRLTWHLPRTCPWRWRARGWPLRACQSSGRAS